MCDICGLRGGACPCAPPPLIKMCPLCKVASRVELEAPIFTGADCVVCMESSAMILFTRLVDTQSHAGTALSLSNTGVAPLPPPRLCFSMQRHTSGC